MRNLRIDSLLYTFVSLDDRCDFSQAAAWEGDVGSFHCRLDKGRLEARPQGHYPNVQQAKEALECHLRSWELASELEHAKRIRFRYSEARVTDLASGAVNVESADLAASSTTVSGGVAHVGESYPPPRGRP